MNVAIPFIGGFKKSRSISFNAQRTINLFLELDPSGKGPVGMFLAPGKLSPLVTLPNGPVRGMRALDSYMYAVGGPTLYKVDAAGVYTNLGNVGGGAGPASISDNGVQVAVLTDGQLAIYNTSTGIFAANSDPDFGGGSLIDYLDGYFLAGPQGRQSFQISAIGNGTSWALADTTAVEGASGQLVGLLVANRQVWLWKQFSARVYWNSGNAAFPLEPIDGADTEYGLAAKYSSAKTDNTVFWLTANRDGYGQVAKAEAYRPVMISSRALEEEIQSYSRIDDAIGWTYQQGGHTFYVLTFPTARKTWAYDVSIQDPEMAWHERVSYGSDGASLGRDIANCHCFFNGRHYVGDYRSGAIYELRTDVYDENSLPMVWERTGQYISDDGEPIRFNSFEIDCETGVGLVSGQGSDPQVGLQWSDDGGKTWSNILFRSLGAIGATRTRVLWNKLGSSKGKGRVFRLTGSDPVKTAIFKALCDMSR